MLTLLLLPCLLADAPVPPEAPDDRQSEEIRLEITTTAWFPRLVGSYSFGPNGTSLDVETDTNLHSSEVGFMGELGFRAEAWEFRLIGSTFETSGEGRLNAPARVAGVDLPAQAAWASTYSQWMIRPELDVAIWRPFADEPFPWSAQGSSPGNRNADGDYLVDLRIAGRIGFEYMHVTQTFDSSTAGLRVVQRGGWSAVVLGIIVGVGIDTRPLLPWLHELEIESGITASPIIAGGSGWLYSIEASMRGYLTPNAALTFGFRLQGTNATSDQYQREGSIMGLIAGASIRF